MRRSKLPAVARVGLPGCLFFETRGFYIYPSSSLSTESVEVLLLTVPPFTTSYGEKLMSPIDICCESVRVDIPCDIIDRSHRCCAARDVDIDWQRTKISKHFI